MTRKKDRVLNTRIPEELDRELKRHAEHLDVSVSQYVRDVLERTVNLVGNFSGNVEHLVADIVDDVGHFRSIGAPDRAARDTLAKELAKSVIGWQEVRVNRASRCPLTGEMLRVGDTAHLGIRTNGRGSMLISAAALEELLRPAEPMWTPLTVQNETRCARTGETISRGDRAWFDPTAEEPEFICDAEHARLTSHDPESS